MSTTEYILFISYGKDQLACLGAIEQLGWPLDRVVHAEVWATDTIPADLPPMIEFKAKADQIIKERWGIEVEHIYATRFGKKATYEDIFYRPRTGGADTRIPDVQRSLVQQRTENGGNINGFAHRGCPWCTGELKKNVFSKGPSASGGKHNVVHYVGIAIDEPERLARIDGITKKSPLAAIGWTEADAKQWCIENDLLSPIYETTNRGGCWFCHNQTISQMRNLWKEYPDLWEILLKWDSDSPVKWQSSGHTVHDYDKRFRAESLDLVPSDRRFKWKMLDDLDI